MKKLRNLMIGLLTLLCLALQVSAAEEIVYKQDKLYVYVSPDYNVEELYCQVQYGADNSWEVPRMTPVEGQENVWVIEDLPKEITHICPVYDEATSFGGYDARQAEEDDNMFLVYSSGDVEWCTYDPDAVYEEPAPDEDTAPEEDVAPGEEPAPDEDVTPEEDGVPEEAIVYKQDVLYVYVAPGCDIIEPLYCNTLYGLEEPSGEITEMTPVEGHENVWVIENLPDEITGIGPFYYDGCNVGINGFEISEVGENDNMCLCYSDGSGEWCIFDPDAVYEDKAHKEDPAPGEDVEPDEDSTENLPTETLPTETLPEGVKDMGSCGENATYTLYDDGLLVIEGEGSVNDWAFSSRQDITKVEIRDGITHLGRGSFTDSSATEVIMADSVTTLGNEYGGDMFSGCTNLKYIKLSENLQNMPSGMFGGSGLTEIVIPDSVTDIDPFAFSGWDNLQKITIGGGIKSIPYELFYVNDNLTEVVLSEGVESIEVRAFHCMNKLQSIIIPDSVKYIGENAFYECVSLTNVVLGNGITELPENAFYGCTSLKEIELPETLITIGEAAFMDCTSLEEIVIPDSVTSLNGGQSLGTSGLGAFGGCTNLKSITIGKGVELIPWGCFCESGLETLILPENVTQIDAYAISTNPNLTYVEIHGELESVENHALGSNPSLTNIVFYGNAPKEVETMMGICGNYISATFYPKDNPTWKDVWVGTEEMVPYTLDTDGNIIPEAPEKSEVLAAMERFRSGEHFNYARDMGEGKSYPNNYRYYINGNFIEGKGSEAFAFELSDACFRFLPISDHRDVVYADLQVGDLLYMGDQVWVIAEIDANGAKVHGAEKEVIVYDKSLTKAQVEAADSYRTRYGVSPGPGEVNDYLSHKVMPESTDNLTEQIVYDRILALQEDYPEGMPWNEKNYYKLNVGASWIVEIDKDTVQHAGLERNGHACSAFGYLASDTAFGDLPATYYTYDKADYDNIMVGDNLLGMGHQVVVLEVYKNCLVITEGNYNGMIHWARILAREEVEGYYDVLTRYPEGTVAPERGYYEIPEEPEETIPPETEPEETVPPATEPEETQPTEPSHVHTWTGWTVDPSPTKEKEGKQTRTCSQCGEVQTQVLEKLKGSFKDVLHTQYYALPVEWAAEKGITTGTSKTSFSPDNPCTRGQIVTFIWRAKGKPEPKSTNNPFKDVKSTDYFYKAVLWAVEQGITNGLSDTSFGPNQGCTRGQVCTFLWRAQGQPSVSGSNPFKDVKKGEYYYNAVLWAVENGITNGMGGGKFAPGDTCTRGQIVTFLYRSLA